MLPASVRDAKAELIAGLRGLSPCRLIQRKHHNLTDHLTEVFLHSGEVLRTYLVHERKLLHNGCLSMDSLFFSDLQITDDFLLGCEHSLNSIVPHRAPTTSRALGDRRLNLLELLSGP